MRGNIQNVSHLMSGRLGPTAGLGVVTFETSLRGGLSTPQLEQREKLWSSIPKKDRKGIKRKKLINLTFIRISCIFTKS